MNIDKISKKLTDNSQIEEEGGVIIDKISKQSMENSKIKDKDVISIDNISKQSMENSKTKEPFQEVPSETRLLMIKKQIERGLLFEKIS